MVLKITADDTLLSFTGYSRDLVSARVRQSLKTSLRVALKARDATSVAALRSALSAIDNAEAVDRSTPTARLGVGAADVARRELSTEEVLAILRTEVAERTSAAAEYELLGRTEQAARLRAEAATLASYLEEG